MDNNQVKQSKNDSLIRGESFYQLVKSDGWKYIKLYFENKVKSFTTSMIIEDKSIIEYEAERNEIKGIRNLFGFIDNDIKILEDENKKDTGVAKE